MDDEAINTSQVEDVEFDGFNVTTDENNEKTYNCKTCDTVKDNPKGIKLHIAMKHKHKKPKPKPSTEKIIEESLDGGDFDPLVHSQTKLEEPRKLQTCMLKKKNLPQKMMTKLRRTMLSFQKLHFFRQFHHKC